jgi:AhpD family alkylhydroperoxidase
MTTTARLSSMELWKLLPLTNQAVVALGETAEQGGLEPNLIEMVNLRCSQINGCAYCIAYHTENLIKSGVSLYTCALIGAWEEAGIFSERERAAFAWAEALTLIAETHVPDDAYAAASAVFSDRELASLTTAIATINVWNRLAVTYRFPPEIPE